MKSNQNPEGDVWIIAQINDSFLYVNEEAYNVFVLMNAVNASLYGHVIAPITDASPRREDVESLFDTAIESLGGTPAKIIVPDDSKAGYLFRAVAQERSIRISKTPMTELSPVIGSLIKAFSQLDTE